MKSTQHHIDQILLNTSMARSYCRALGSDFLGLDPFPKTAVVQVVSALRQAPPEAVAIFLCGCVAMLGLKVARNCKACELDVPSLALVEIFWISRHRGQVFAITTVQQLVTRMAGLFAVHPDM